MKLLTIFLLIFLSILLLIKGINGCQLKIKYIKTSLLSAIQPLKKNIVKISIKKKIMIYKNVAPIVQPVILYRDWRKILNKIPSIILEGLGTISLIPFFIAGVFFTLSFFYVMNVFYILFFMDNDKN
jgi:hypothetical protein